MLSQEELLEKCDMLLMAAVDVMESGNPNVSPVWTANGIAAARLLFDMAHSDILFPTYAVSHGGEQMFGYLMEDTVNG
jgi:hypothetical protein